MVKATLVSNCQVKIAIHSQERVGAQEGTLSTGKKNRKTPI
jgi:hypothetical protein